MEKHIIVKENRTLVVKCNDYVGTIGENNATTLHFDFPEALREYQKELIFNTAQGSFTCPFTEESFKLPAQVLTDSCLKMQIVLKSSDGSVKWQSKHYVFKLYDSLNASGDNAFTHIQEEVKAQVLKGVETSLEPMFEFFKEYDHHFESPDDPVGGGTFPIEPEIPNEGDDEFVTE